MIIGLTGKSCSGKNVASDYMTKLGWKVLDLDVLGHDLLIKKSSEVEQVFGTTDRRELARIVFNDKEKLTKLESLLYPEIIEAVLEADKTNPIVVANGALLHRAGLDRICKYIIYIDASYTVRLMRALSRDAITAKDFQLRDSAQNDVHYNDVKYESQLIVLNNDVDCTQQLKEVCKKISLGQGIL